METQNNDIIEQLERLATLHNDGNLTEEEFALAKKKLLATHNPAPRAKKPKKNINVSPSLSSSLPKEFNQFAEDESLGRAANRYVSLQTVMSIVGVILFCIMGLFMCSEHKKSSDRFDRNFRSFQGTK